MNNKVKQMAVAAGSLAWLLPAFALAVSDVEGIFITIIRIINSYVIPLIIGLAVVWFLYGVLQYVMAGGEEDAKKKGRDHMIYGIIALFVMVSVWGLVNLLSGTFDLNTTRPVDGLPEIPRS